MTIKVGDLVSYASSGLIGLVVKTDPEVDWCLIHWFVCGSYTKNPGKFSLWEITNSVWWKKLS